MSQKGIHSIGRIAIATYTSSGYWNAIATEDFITQNFSEVRWPRNRTLPIRAMMDAAIVYRDMDYFYFDPRPAQLIPGVKTLTG
ncbi:MAG: hypothetical protein ABI416_05575, partial [Ginsengibacter sp.]